MTVARLTSKFIVSALLKRLTAAGGHGAVLARGDADAGGIILACADKGQISALLELAYDLDGRMTWRACFVQAIESKEKFDIYLSGRRENDPDLWVVELDIPAAERFAADFVSEG